MILFEKQNNLLLYYNYLTMVNLNKKVSFVLTCALFVSPLVVSAQSDAMMVGASTTSQNMVQNPFFVKGKIDGYKVVLNWTSFESADIVGYKVTLTNAKQEQKTFSVEKGKNTLENYDATAWINVYQVFAMGSDGELAKTNELKLSMGANGGYDFSQDAKNMQAMKGSGALKQEFKSEKEALKTEYKNKTEANKEDLKTSIEALKEERKQEAEKMREDMKNQKQELNLTQDQMTQLKSLKEALEKELATMRSSISKDNIDAIKEKAQALKTAYIAKAQEIAPNNTQVVKLIEERFQIFNMNQFETREKVSEIKDKAKETQQATKDTYKKAKEELVNKYKAKFETKYKEKIAQLDETKLQAILTKLEAKIKQVWESTTDVKKKELILAQLQALKGVISDIIDEKTSDVNIDEILN